jgi:predicted small lipoprotein YifL
MKKMRQILGLARSMTQIIGITTLLFAGVSSLQGCGQKGPLYLPTKHQTAPTTNAAPGSERPGAAPQETPVQR